MQLLVSNPLGSKLSWGVDIMDELSAEELNRLKRAGESKYVEYKEAADLADQDEVLRQLTAFANRAGGTLLYGIRRDGSVEGATIDYESELEKITNLAQNRTSPGVEFSPLFYYGSEGNVLALRVIKRKGVPCAIVHRRYHEIDSRRYYVRTNSGVRLMDDRTLEWLFLHQDDPEISDSFRSCIQYRRDDISLISWIHQPMLLPPMVLTNIFQNLTQEQREFLKSSESKNMMRFLAELLPYAIIGQLSQLYHRSWKVKVTRIGDMTQFNWIDSPFGSESINVDELALADNTSVLKNVSFSISDILTISKVLQLPAGASMDVRINEHVSTLSFNKTGAFNISFRIHPSSWTVGVASGHPLASAFGGFQRIEEQLELQQRIACVCLDINFAANFEFPDEPSDEIVDYFNWAQQILAEVKSQWDWDRLVGSLPPGILYSIERDVREILSHLRGPDQRK